MSTSANSRPREHKYYPLVKQALENLFRNYGYCVDFEVTGHRGKKRVPKRFLYKDEKLLTRYLRELPTPDLMGLVWKQGDQNKKLVIAEFKPSPRFGDVF